MQNPKLKHLYETWLEEATITDMQEKMESGELTSKELILMYLYRIAEFDHNGPGLRSVLEINPDALHIAEALDAERKESGPRGPLHGIPVLLKDNIDTADKLHTSAGSKALADSYALEDSEVASGLRIAGAVILGKTNMTEWANFMSYTMESGYSSRGGQTLNPYGPGKFNVGGSSAGSGAAVAANFAAAAIGTETSGSILNPACQNSLVGIKPTVGLISRRGIIPIAHSQDTAGPMARTVEDAALLLTALTVSDTADPATLANQLQNVEFTEFLKKGLAGKKIGVARDYFFSQAGEEKARIADRALEVLESLGAEVVDIVIPSARLMWDWEVLKYEFKAGVNAYLKGLAPSVKIRALSDVIRFNEENPEEMLRYGQQILINSDETSGGLYEDEYIRSLEFNEYHAKENGIDSVLQEYGLDAILFPHDEGCDLSARAGYPSVCVPAGFTDEGEPVGITFAGTAWSEPVLIQIAYAFEQATLARKAPVLNSEKETTGLAEQ
ncbi:amidase [Bacillus sp. FJAT-27225]|uniref:amidase family protein n=1 Tax=Bacillus sp. FJAT-27225 TaxID=1743144 RepID=UPI00080C305E|nr:amidase family protein [Bacillus sp. FJAT-27225]OCA83084.1 amidase [Bacillus sp. FJAT-27225]